MKWAESAMAAALALLLVSCATPIHKSLDNLKVGMDKSEVLELAGNPKRTQRKGSQDIWTYVYFLNDKEFQRDVRLQQSVVTEISPPLEAEAKGTNPGDSVVLRDYEQLVNEAKSKKAASKFTPVAPAKEDNDRSAK